MLLLILERDEGRDRERDKNINRNPEGGWNPNLGMCLDRKLNL